MKEDFLHVLWQQQLIAHSPELRLADGQTLYVLRTGFRNRLAGPDFLQASLRIGPIEWVGAVEIHVRASEWNQHRHQIDPAYNPVILHVVWENDTTVYRLDQTPVPVLELKDKVPLDVLLRYRELLDRSEKEAIPCASGFREMDPIHLRAMMETALAHRLERKAAIATDLLENVRGNPREWIYRHMAYCLGLRLNAEPMLQLASRIPMAKLENRPQEVISCLLLGMGGFLEKPGGETGRKLQELFGYECQRYPWDKTPLAWQRFRVRPLAFPIVRVSWLSAIIGSLPGWIQAIYTGADVSRFKADLRTARLPSHLQAFLQEEGYPLSDRMPGALIENLLLNGLVPVVAALSWRRGEPEAGIQALDWLHGLPPENHTISRTWKALGVEIETAGDSQALKELWDSWCSHRRCLECQVGTARLRAPVQGKIPSSM
jgi:hypothetical protein